MQTFASLAEDDLYILPSSIHKVICVPASFVESQENGVDNLRAMVCEVNETQVSLEERLSDVVFFYSRQNNEIRVA